MFAKVDSELDLLTHLSIGAEARGIIPDPDLLLRKPGEGFRYINCLHRDYDNKEKIVTSVEFYLSRYGEHKHTISFQEPVSEMEAIQAVESYLSQPLDEAYYSKIQDDLVHRLAFEDALKLFTCRGDCLWDCKLLDHFDIIEGHMDLWLGA
jgi:hypothetical protein